MEQDLRRPEYKPRKHDRSASTFNQAIAAIGVTLLTFCLVGSAAITTVWAVGTLFDVSQFTFLVLAGLVAIPVLALSIWTAGRAWHVERRMAAGLDIDTPVYSMLHYFRKST